MVLLETKLRKEKRMQTFLPYPDFKKSLEVLDWRRLGNQRKEADQILKTLLVGSRWANHPAVKMWKGYESALIRYRNLSISVWVARRYNNKMEILPEGKRVIMPWWLGWEEFHRSHRSNLLRKKPEWYSQFGWTEPDDLPYCWPITKNEK